MSSVVSIENFGAGESSGELRAIFETVTESTVNGVPKFAPAVCRRLIRSITARTYASPIHELCHLVRIAGIACGPDNYEDLFWGGGPATAAGSGCPFGRRSASRFDDSATSDPPDEGKELHVLSRHDQLTWLQFGEL